MRYDYLTPMGGISPVFLTTHHPQLTIYLNTPNMMQPPKVRETPQKQQQQHPKIEWAKYF
jgi:hypothetical protein